MNLLRMISRYKKMDHTPPPPEQHPASKPGRRQGKGQSLVETAVALPVFLLLLLGVFEVGWALRAYLVLANVNREATRFAARGVYLDLKQKADPELVGYEKVLTHTLDALSLQLNPVSFDAAQKDASIVITYYNIEPQAFSCPGDDDCSDFDCSKFANPSDPNYPSKSTYPGANYNIVEYPLLEPPPPLATSPKLPDWYKAANRVLTLTNTVPITGYYYYRGPLDDVAALSHINTSQKVTELLAKNNELNCQLLKRKLPPTSNNVIIVENIYYLDQLVGLPLVDRFIPDPIPLYTHTAMRMVTNIRALDTPDDDAASCELLPFMIPESRISGHKQGDQVVIPFSASDVLPGSFGWVKWDSDGSTDAVELEDNLAKPGNASKFYDEPPGGNTDNAIDQSLDFINAYTGASASSGIDAQINGYVNSGKVVYFPVWRDQWCTTDCASYYTGTGSNAKYRVLTYVGLKIKGSASYMNGNNPQCDTPTTPGVKRCLIFEFSHFAPGHCTGNGK